MSSKWVECKFEDILSIPIRNGLSKPKAVRGIGVKMVNMGEIFRYSRIYDIDMERVPTTDRELITSRLVAGDLLFARQSLVLEGAGKCSIIMETEEDLVYESHLIRARLNNKIAQPSFYFYYFNSPIGKGNVRSIVEQVAAAGIRGSDLKKLSIPLPPLSEQKTIAATLSCLDDMAELNNHTNQLLEEIAQAIFKHWFVDFEFPNEDGQPYKSSGGAMVDSELGEIPEGWRVGILDECIDFINGYAFSSKDLLDEHSDDCYHVFKMGHIKKGGGLNNDGTKSYIPKDQFNLSSKYILKKGDLLMCMTDMKANVALLGHTALMNEDNKYVVNQRVGLLRINNDFGISYLYLYILTNSKDILENLRGRANSGVQVNLYRKQIKT